MKLTRRGAMGAAASLGSLATAGWARKALAAMPEGKPGPDLIAHVGTGLQTDLADRLIEPFADLMNQKYGVPVRVQTVVGQSPAAWAAFKTQWPNPDADVYQLYNEYIKQGAAEGYFLRLRDFYDPPVWAKFDKDAVATMDVDGYTAPLSLSASVLVVQNSLGDAVTSWKDLGDPKYAKRVTFDSALSVGSGYNMIAAAALAIGNDWNGWFKDGKLDEAAAMPAFKECARWAGNALTLTQGSGSITPLLRRGEALFSAWWWQQGQRENEIGTPVHVVYPKEGIPASVETGPVVQTHAKNPIAAIEWAKFFHSDTADELAVPLHEYDRIPREGSPTTAAWDSFTKQSHIVWINDFRSKTLGPIYNEQVLDLYNRIVIQGG
jgi:ABC-type Fe3+ transport system substrate-binding protein